MNWRGLDVDLLFMIGLWYGSDHQGRPFEKCDQNKCTSTSWVTSNQKVLTYDCDLTWIIDLDFGESFSPTPGIRATFQYAKYITKYEISNFALIMI